MQALMEICRRQALQVIDSALFACEAGDAKYMYARSWFPEMGWL